jgi:alkanesulfonate monooxygenase SsuD/methylene tetrahydromethanopterin reductase-like flavin-dependent oxidoreductase (luciferase family)
MKLMWFHLMPHTELPENLRDANFVRLGGYSPSLFDPKRTRLMYNDVMDEVEDAADVGFDAICVNEHHSSGYGLMTSPNLIAASLSHHTTDTAICVMGNSLALYNPPMRVAEQFAMLDRRSGGPVVALSRCGADAPR